MGLFAKVFSSLWEGSMIGKPDSQLVFVFLLAHANRDGFVDVTHKRIAVLTGLDEARVRAAVTELEQPDPDSRTPGHEGRRLLRIGEHRDWGWQIVNYTLYRGLRDEEQRREQAREGMRRLRSERAPGHEDADRMPRGPAGAPAVTVSNVSRRWPPLAHVDRDGDVDTASTPLSGSASPGSDPGQGTLADPAGSAPSSPVLGLPTPPLALRAPAAQRPPYAVLFASGGKEWEVPEALERELAALYPAVNVPRALANMRGYLLTNNRRRPTAAGMPRFINAWLKKDQDRAAAAATYGPKRGTRGGSDQRYEEANRGGDNE